MDEQDLTIDQVARITQVNRKTVVKWINNGLLEAYDIGGNHKRVKPAKLEEFRQKRGVSNSKKETRDKLPLAG
jgi:excisionase family DNA binding protein